MNEQPLDLISHLNKKSPYSQLKNKREGQQLSSKQEPPYFIEILGAVENSQTLWTRNSKGAPACTAKVSKWLV